MREGGGADAGAAACDERGHIACAVSREGAHRLEVDPPPDLRLKEAVEVLDRVLQAEFPGWHEDRRDAQLEAQQADPAERIPVLMRSLKAGVVVELGKAGSPVVPPVRDDSREHRGGSGPFQRPCGGEAAVQRDPGEHVEQWAIGQFEIFDHVEEIELGLPSRHHGQMPPGWGRRPPLALASIQGAPAGQDSADGAERGRRLPPALQRRLDGPRTVLSEEAIPTQRAAQREDASFEGRRCAIGRRMAIPTMITPVHPIKPAGARSAQPVLHSGEAEIKAAGHGALTLPIANSLDQPAPLGFLRGFLLIATWRLGVFSPS